MVSSWEHTFLSTKQDQHYTYILHFQTKEFIYNYVISSAPTTSTDYWAGHRDLKEVFSAASSAYECQTGYEISKKIHSCSEIDVDLDHRAISQCLGEAFLPLGRSSGIKKEFLIPK